MSGPIQSQPTPNLPPEESSGKTQETKREGSFQGRPIRQGFEEKDIDIPAQLTTREEVVERARTDPFGYGKTWTNGTNLEVASTIDRFYQLLKSDSDGEGVRWVNCSADQDVPPAR